MYTILIRYFLFNLCPCQVEIYPGSGVLVDKLTWAYALNSTSATVFVRHLLTAVFSLDILLVSNLRGSSKGRGDARLPLDKNKLEAIYSTFYLFNCYVTNYLCFCVCPSCTMALSFCIVFVCLFM